MEGMASVPVDELIRMNDAMRAFDECKIMLAGPKWYHPGEQRCYEQEVRYIGKDEALIRMQNEIDRQVKLLNAKDSSGGSGIYNSSFRSRLHFLFTGRLN